MRLEDPSRKFDKSQGVPDGERLFFVKSHVKSHILHFFSHILKKDVTSPMCLNANALISRCKTFLGNEHKKSFRTGKRDDVTRHADGVAGICNFRC